MANERITVTFEFRGQNLCLLTKGGKPHKPSTKPVKAKSNQKKPPKNPGSITSLVGVKNSPGCVWIWCNYHQRWEKICW